MYRTNKLRVRGEHMTRVRSTLSTRPKKKTNCQKKKTGGLHLDRFGRGGGVDLCWLCLARAFSGSKE
jgi:hypothetical protein